MIDCHECRATRKGVWHSESWASGHKLPGGRDWGSMHDLEVAMHTTSIESRAVFLA